MNTYLGRYGYTLFKNEISVEQQNKIKSDLMVKPYTPGSPVQTANVFPAYRESGNKIYVPRYYGEEHFGLPKEYKISEGEDINLEFKGTLRDYQKPVIEKFVNYMKQNTTASSLLELYCAWGKTSSSLYAMTQLKKKTLVIVHKEFLANQWEERIGVFVPNARIGRIQGQICDIENKDIVICMLQTLVSKDFSASTFDSFGFTIIDEVHHISSQTFSNALFKLVTKYMLGLSATMTRKDGTTKVFKLFLGEVLYKAERKDDIPVEVRAITFKTNDEEFNETTLDYKGQPQISTMINKLCNYSYRTEFIIKVINDFISDNSVDDIIKREHKIKMDSEVPCCSLCNKNNNYLMKNTCCNCVKYCLLCLDSISNNKKNCEETIINQKTGEAKIVKRRPKCPNCNKVLFYEQNYIENPYVKPKHVLQTIILSHNISILDYIYKRFVCKNYASIGYYVGGMKEEELKQSENKQIILGSFAMCAEGLDIPGLNAEFLITPKTDIEQIVGRILRAKHPITNPVIYDIKDSHEVFEKQWNKRKSFYKKNNYKIIETDSFNYKNINTKWKNIFTPKTISNCDNNLSSKSDTESDDEDDFKVKKDPLAGKCLLMLPKKK